jgi:hypothetical protein
VQSVESDRVLLQQLFYGYQRYKKPLRVLMSALFFNHGSSLNRGDYTMMCLISYLLLFRLEEMGWARVKALVSSQSLSRMHVLLGFLLDREMTTKWLLEDWGKLLDRAFVDEKMLGGMYRCERDIRAWMGSTHASAFGATAAAAAAALDSDHQAGEESKVGSMRKSTRPKSPNITKPKPRLLPVPARIEQSVKARPMPKNLNRVTLEGIREQDEQRRQRVKEETLRRHAGAKEPALHETRNTVDALRQTIEMERSAQLQFDAPKANPIPELPLTGADVRLNATAILREDYVMRQRQEKEAALVKQFESELRDASEFYQWQMRMKAEDEEAERQGVLLRKEELEKSAMEARAAVERDLRQKQRAASAMRRQREMTEELSRKEKDVVRMENQALAAAVKQERDTAPKDAAREIVEARAEDAARIREESVRIAEQVKEREEQLALERADKVRQLQAIERVPRAHTSQPFDPTTTHGHGMLDEMSLLEARERIAMQKARELEETEAKRRSIMVERRQKQLDLEQRMHSISRVRSSASVVARNSRERRISSKAEAEAALDATRSESLVRLEQKLREKREKQDLERAMLEEESRKVARRNMFLGAAKLAMEEKRFDELRQNGEAVAKTAALRARDAHVVEEASKAKGAEERRRLLRQERQQRRSLRVAADEVKRVASTEAAAVAATDRREKKEAFATSMAREERLHLTRAMDNVYATTVTEFRADEARRAWGGPDRAVTRDEVLQARKARLRMAQAEATGLTATLEQRAVVRSDLEGKMRSTLDESMRITKHLQGGLSASRKSAPPRKRAVASPRAAGPVLTDTAMDDGKAVHAQRNVLFATRRDADSWEALQR